MSPSLHYTSDFLQSLDGGNAKLVRAQKASNPTHTYFSLWDELDKKMSRNTTQTQRAKLENLIFKYQGKVCSRDLDIFEADFKMTLADHPGVTQKEASLLYARKSPGFLPERVEKENLKKAGMDVFW